MPGGLVAEPAHRLACLIRDRQVTALDVVEAHLAQIERVNPALHAVVQLRAEGAPADARAADARLARGEPAGPLHGVPFTVKDWIETNDLPCAAGIEERRNYIPARDATAVARMRAAGAILLGKTKPGNDDAVYPRANNPHDPTRTPGGSSAGEAAIIAAFGSPLGLGSDSGGSLRWPAHCCGIATLKPTFGLVPNTGHFPRTSPLSDPRTVIGPMARSVADLAIALKVIAGVDYRDASVVPLAPGDPSTVDLRGLRAAVYTEMPGASPTVETVAATRAAAAILAAAGVEVVDATPPRLEESLPITIGYWRRPSSSASLTEWLPSPEPGIATGDGAPRQPLTATGVARNLFEWDRFRASMLRFIEPFDAIICPVAETPAPPHETPVNGATYLYMLPYSLNGYPVAVVPAATSPEGLPIGVQIVAKPWQDHLALALAAAIER
ncbi:MAG: amidase [Chloroflexi bacterium]|nr:amidase [Chloroflexota bacterium]